MRIRSNPRALELVQQHSDIVIFRPQEYKGRWRQYFNERCGNGPDAPLKIELGMGRGKFITDNAMLNKNDDFIGIDLRAEIMFSALQKVLEQELNNVLMLPLNITY
jgi:tRNA (guanine-N7-)-methyltransferase